MSDFNRNGEEVRAQRSLSNALAVLLPPVLAKLEEDAPETARSVNEHVYKQVEKARGRVPIEIILGEKYKWLVKNKKMTPLTPQQIQEANQQKKAA